MAGACDQRELDPLVLRSFEETMREIGSPPDARTELGRQYLETVHRLGVL